MTATRRLLQHWGGENASAYLVEAIECAIAQIAAGEWTGYAATRVVKHEIGRRLTIESPTDLVVP
ncbi:hypothetical protein QBL02_12165 [Leucobacter sp. UT-8R-CII-1-4]|uniref:hypothetical protein n=1 Tax=Leucobacter sp. UT-8R-CII-1-4 TaxID=3040075 RepID=UPI0024A96DA2|nr:hypothetical protein [Leucobacter sp. UT-8R-CII-1-4]MDI6024295.1 hypothetical protein [Leucobacter sp. UT-8R-CII-1-4]